jgi:hypothetical protein
MSWEIPLSPASFKTLWLGALDILRYVLCKKSRYRRAKRQPKDK